MSTYVLVHAAWHTGTELEPVAALMRAAGHQVFTPTLAGNRPGDVKTTGLEEQVRSIVDFLTDTDLNDVILLGHSSGGMVITGVADRVPHRIRRLVYCNAFVANNGEAITDLVPPYYPGLLTKGDDGSIALPFPIWREAYINDADFETAQRAYDRLNPQPFKTFTDKAVLRTNPAEMTLPKSFINCTEDMALPHGFAFHPVLSAKLGLFRLVQIPGSHELCFTNPARLAQAIVEAGRD
ncbi:alpha/beta fold hydrolase [Bradyrhizobium sp. SYSU BS000235]|uniref:alpha/beta fold hydrolase n=1 Tax=Bradyrhizobium sp. SYSU BS000235 TaxID=3411332 RepID=UPI003C776A6E